MKVTNHTCKRWALFKFLTTVSRCIVASDELLLCFTLSSVKQTEATGALHSILQRWAQPLRPLLVLWGLWRTRTLGGPWEDLFHSNSGLSDVGRWPWNQNYPVYWLRSEETSQTSHGEASALRDTICLIRWLTFLKVIFYHRQVLGWRCHLGTFLGFLWSQESNVPLRDKGLTWHVSGTESQSLLVFTIIVFYESDGVYSCWEGIPPIKGAEVWQKTGKGGSNTPGTRRRIISPLAPSPRSKASSSLALTSLDFCRTWVLTLSELGFPWTGQRKKDVLFGEISVYEDTLHNRTLQGEIGQYGHVLYRDTVLGDPMAESLLTGMEFSLQKARTLSLRNYHIQIGVAYANRLWILIQK